MERDVLPTGGETLPKDETVRQYPLTLDEATVDPATEERIRELEQLVAQLQKDRDFFKGKLTFYEQNGSAKLYYALNRKSNEVGDLLNANSFANINMDDKDSKSFDRIFKLIEKSEVIAKSLEALKQFAGITGDEKKDVDRRPFNDRLAEERK